MAQRGWLATSRVEEFAAWAIEQRGFTRLPPSRGAYEVLRLRPQSGKGALVLYHRDRSHVHVTVQSNWVLFVNEFMRRYSNGRRYIPETMEVER